MNNFYQSQQDKLAQYTTEGRLYRSLADQKIKCYACGHRCLIREGRTGVCRIRFNHNGVLCVPHGYVAGLNCDPIEKKPFFHVLPGSDTMSFGMLGCNLHCSFCQNWQSSQAVRDDRSTSHFQPVSAERLVHFALQSGSKSITSTYNEPLITTEWAVEIFQLAKDYDLYTSYVSNGNATPEVIEYIHPWIDFYNVDLKCFRDRSYRKLGCTLNAVLDTIRLLFEKNIWIEIVTLVVPQFNDSDGELRDIAHFIASISPTIPWHVTAFHEDYQMYGNGRTPGKTLLRAAEIGKEEGLHFVYTGNLPGQTQNWENTYCPHCGILLVERIGYQVRQNLIDPNYNDDTFVMNLEPPVMKNPLHTGVCYHCKTPIPGVWG